MEDKTFTQFQFFLAQHVVEFMIFSVDIATLTPCYFHHQITCHHHHKLMISTCPP
jgi:hypothetical protein